jgi:hypothetical protein
MENEKKDDELWKLAKKRVGFKQALVVYLCVNAFLIGLWYFDTGPGSYFWPKWSLLGWGLGLAIHYFQAFHGTALFSTENEYQKLNNRQNR